MCVKMEKEGNASSSRKAGKKNRKNRKQEKVNKRCYFYKETVMNDDEKKIAERTKSSVIDRGRQGQGPVS